MLKSYGVGGGVGGDPCDFSVSQSPFGLDFGTLDFVTSDSGLKITDINNMWLTLTMMGDRDWEIIFSA